MSVLGQKTMIFTFKERRYCTFLILPSLYFHRRPNESTHSTCLVSSKHNLSSVSSHYNCMSLWVPEWSSFSFWPTNHVSGWRKLTIKSPLSSSWSLSETHDEMHVKNHQFIFPWKCTQLYLPLFSTTRDVTIFYLIIQKLVQMLNKITFCIGTYIIFYIVLGKWNNKKQSILIFIPKISKWEGLIITDSWYFGKNSKMVLNKSCKQSFRHLFTVASMLSFSGVSSDDLYDQIGHVNLQWMPNGLSKIFNFGWWLILAGLFHVR